MTDIERRQTIETLCSYYDGNFTSTALRHLPLEHEDESGEKMERYFDFLQGIFLCREEDSTDEDRQLLTSLAKEFNFPMYSIEALYV